MRHSNPNSPGSATDEDVRALLARHRCPTPFHAVRSLLMGNIASPRLEVSPLKTLAQMWGGEMPVFTTPVDVEEVTGILVQGLWNRLANHQSSRNPFRLTRFEVTPTRQALHDLAVLRAQEIEAFVDGLFGPEDEMMMPSKMHEAVQALGELSAMFDGTAGVLADKEKPAPAQELKSLLRNLQQLTIIADELINKVVQSGKRSRSHWLEATDTVPSKRFTPSGRKRPGEADVSDIDNDQGPEFIASPLSQNIMRNGVSVRVEIYAHSEGGWILEVVDSDQTSHVWDEPFETEQQALAEAIRALDEETLDFAGSASNRPLS